MIQLLTDWLGYSFRKVTQLAVKGFQSIGYRAINVVNLWFPLGLVNTKTIVIGDTVFSLRLASRFNALEKVYWVDSPLEINAGDARLLGSGDCL
ncbi:MAG: hypothetical protein LM583_05750, partial [Desulfurococcaceae archaeon]|nr:hypothetical protein [Desulfurococcaceae archaeon]